MDRQYQSPGKKKCPRCRSDLIKDDSLLVCIGKNSPGCTYRRPAPTNKYNPESTKIDGHFCASKLEASVGQILHLREKAKVINDIRYQVQTWLTDARIGWKVDFSFWERSDEQRVYCEAKGIETSDYRIKLKLWRVYGPGPLEIWKGTYQNPQLVEVIYPRQVKSGVR